MKSPFQVFSFISQCQGGTDPPAAGEPAMEALRKAWLASTDKGESARQAEVNPNSEKKRGPYIPEISQNSFRWASCRPATFK